MPETEALETKIAKLKGTIRRFEIFTVLYAGVLAGATLLSEANRIHVTHQLRMECDRYQQKADEWATKALEQRAERDKLEGELREAKDRDLRKLFQVPAVANN